MVFKMANPIWRVFAVRHFLWQLADVEFEVEKKQYFGNISSVLRMFFKQCFIINDISKIITEM